MAAGNYYKKGDHNAICYVCGFEYKSCDMKLRWDGVYVCKEDWEPRQPQDFVRAPAGEQAPVWTQPEPPDTFVNSSVLKGNIVIGTPQIYLNGALQTSGVNYTISLPDGTVTFTTPPAANVTIAWSGVWRDNALTDHTYTQFPLYKATGFTTVYGIYGVF